MSTLRSFTLNIVTYRTLTSNGVLNRLHFIQRTESKITQNAGSYIHCGKSCFHCWFKQLFVFDVKAIKRYHISYGGPYTDTEG